MVYTGEDMKLHAAILRYDPERPPKLFIDTHRAALAWKVMGFIKGALMVVDPELLERINWDTSSYDQYDQYMAFTVEGNRPIEIEYYGEYDTHNP